MVGLANVDNTGDLETPISTATQIALNDLTGYIQTMHYSRDEIDLIAMSSL